MFCGLAQFDNLEVTAYNPPRNAGAGEFERAGRSNPWIRRALFITPTIVQRQYQKGKQPSFCDFLISVICGCCARLLVEVVAIPADFTPLFFGKIIGAIFRPIVRLSQPSIREYIAVPAQQLPVDQTKRIEQS
jgi:hypothetical protein